MVLGSSEPAILIRNAVERSRIRGDPFTIASQTSSIEYPTFGEGSRHRWRRLRGAVSRVNANGREIGSVDSQPNKFAARELLQRHTLTLNYVVGATPQLIERHSFVRDLNGNYRSAYSPFPPILAASIAWPLVKVGALNLKAPLAPNVIAVLAASVLLRWRSARLSHGSRAVDA